jgi:hypothetical protein
VQYKLHISDRGFVNSHSHTPAEKQQSQLSAVYYRRSARKLALVDVNVIVNVNVNGQLNAPLLVRRYRHTGSSHHQQFF